MKHLLAAALCALSAACTTTAGGGYTQRLTGSVIPTGAGHAGDRCKGPSTATLIIDKASRRFTFSPDDGALRLSGLVAMDGTIQASTNTQPPGKPPYIVTLRGALLQSGFTGTYETPSCTTAVALNTPEGPGIRLGAPHSGLGL